MSETNEIRKAIMERLGSVAKFSTTHEDLIAELRRLTEGKHTGEWHTIANTWLSRKRATGNREIATEANRAYDFVEREMLARMKQRASRPGAKAKMARGYDDPNRIVDDLTPEQRALEGKYSTAMYKIAAKAAVLASDMKHIAELAEKYNKIISYDGIVTAENKRRMDDLLSTVKPYMKIPFSRSGAKAKFADDAKEVAQEILRQLGGGRFMAMVGGKNATHGNFGGKPGLQVSIGRGAKDGINRLIVTLDRGSDTYDMEFWRIGNRGLSTKKVAEASGVYADSLQRVFTSKTDFHTSMSRPGAKAKMAQVSGSAFITDNGKRFNIVRWLDLSNAPNAVQEVVKRNAIVTDEKGKEWELKIYHDGSFVLRSPTAGGKRIEGKVSLSRPGAKAKFAESVTYSVAVHIGHEPAGERTTKSLEEAKAYAKAMLQTAKANAKGKPVVVDVYPVVNYEPKPAVLTLRASRPGAKSIHAADEAVSKKIALLMDEGYPQDQAVAIALDMKRKGKI